MQSKAKTVDEYLATLPEERREALQKVREVLLKNLPKGYEEGMQYGMIGYFVPHSVYPPGYHCDPKQPLPFGGMASQKNHMSLYLMCIYGDEEQRTWFTKAWTDAGKKLDMGKGCVRFKSIDDVPLKVLGQAIKRVPVKTFIEFYEANVKLGGKRAAKKKAAKKTSAKKSETKPVAPRARKNTVGKRAVKKTVRKRAAVKSGTR